MGSEVKLIMFIEDIIILKTNASQEYSFFFKYAFVNQNAPPPHKSCSWRYSGEVLNPLKHIIMQMQNVYRGVQK